MQKYTFTIISVDTEQHTMAVEYAPENEDLGKIAYNLTAPPADTNIAEYVDQWAPQSIWEKRLNPPNPDLEKLVGMTGQVEPKEKLENFDVVLDGFAASMQKLQAEFEKENNDE